MGLLLCCPKPDRFRTRRAECGHEQIFWNSAGFKMRLPTDFRDFFALLQLHRSMCNPRHFCPVNQMQLSDLFGCVFKQYTDMSDYNMLYYSLWKVLIDIWHSSQNGVLFLISLLLPFSHCLYYLHYSHHPIIFFNIHVVHKGITQEPEINYSVHRPNQSSLICNSCLFKKRLVFKSDRHNYAGKWGEKMEENNYILDLRICKIPPAGETRIVLATFLARLATKWTWGRNKEFYPYLHASC